MPVAKSELSCLHRKTRFVWVQIGGMRHYTLTESVDFKLFEINIYLVISDLYLIIKYLTGTRIENFKLSL